MGFRDDREALRARAEALEAKLRERDERFEALEARLGRVEEALVSAREPTPAQPSSGPPARPMWLPIAAAAGVAVAISAVGAALQREPPVEPPVPDLAPPVVEAPRSTEPPSAVAVPTPEPVMDPVLPPGRPDVRWTATVASVAGDAGVEVGDECVIEGEARTLRFARVAPDALALSIRCGERVLYASTDEATGMTARECVLYEQIAEGGFVHWTRCSDRGVREGRPEMTIDTAVRTARVYRSDGSLDVRLDVAPQSSVRLGHHLVWRQAPPAIASALERDAMAESVDGTLPVRAGERCRLTVEPPDEPSEPGTFNCRVRLRCGARYVYGAGSSGWNVCDVDTEGAATTARDASDGDGDPMLELDLSAGTLTLGSVSAESSGRAVFTLSERAR